MAGIELPVLLEEESVWRNRNTLLLSQFIRLTDYYTGTLGYLYTSAAPALHIPAGREKQKIVATGWLQFFFYNVYMIICG